MAIKDDQTDFSKPQRGPLPPDSDDEEESLVEDDLPLDARDKLAESGVLEVEDMSESNELQERRRKTKSRLQELASTEDSPEGAAFEEEEAGLGDLFKEAKLSGRHLKFCCSGVLGILVLLGLFFGAKKGWEAYQNRPEEESVEESAFEEEETYSFFDPSILIGILLGEEVPEEDVATDVGEELGAQATTEGTLAQMIADFATLYEAMQVDVNELLSQSSDRQGTLEDYESELNYLLYVGDQNVDRLEGESEDLVQQFTAAEENKTKEEEHFFEELRELDPYAAKAALEAFIGEAEEVVRLRAEYNARQKLFSYYREIMEDIERRLKDISLNEEALVKGVQVVEIEGSDLNLIIDENEL